MNYRLIATDLDGTLRAFRQPISPRVRSAVWDAQAAGVRVVIATGRTLLTAEPFARELGPSEILICNHGATIYDLQSRERLFARRIPLQLARQVVTEADRDSTLIVSTDTGFQTPKMTDDALDFVGRDLADQYCRVTPDLATALDEEPTKIVFVGDIEATQQLLLYLSTRWGDQLQVVRAHPRHVELIYRGVSKGMALEWLAERSGIPREQVIAIGDWDNDCSMIQWAGLGVAMGNATENVKAVADYIAPSVEDDGVAHVIEWFVLNSSARREQ